MAAETPLTEAAQEIPIFEQALSAESAESVKSAESTDPKPPASPAAEAAEVSAPEGLEPPPAAWEWTLGGQSVSIPKDALPEETAGQVQAFVDRAQADYATQAAAVAKERQTLKGRAEQLAAFEGISDEMFGSHIRASQLRQEIALLSNADLQTLWREDADQARQVSDALNQRTAELSQVEAVLQDQSRRAADLRQTAQQQQIAEGREDLDRKIKNFSTEKAPALIDYAVANGMDRQEAELWPLNPRLAEMAYKAMLYDKMHTKAKTPPMPVKPIEPGRPVKSSGTGAKKAPEAMTTDEFSTYLATPRAF